LRPFEAFHDFFRSCQLGIVLKVNFSILLDEDGLLDIWDFAQFFHHHKAAAGAVDILQGDDTGLVMGTATYQEQQDTYVEP
jgi:hypothetical protein